MSRNCVRFESEWPADWETFSEEEMVLGAAERNRVTCFLMFSARSDFRIFLEPDRKHPRDEFAVKVMASATFRHIQADVRLGYLSSETARALKDVGEFDARPYSVYLPLGDAQFRVGVRVLVRSPAHSEADQKKSADGTASQSRAAGRDVRQAVFDEVYEHFENVRDEYHCQAVPIGTFREAFDPYFEDALDERCLTERELNDPDLAGEIDVDLTGVMIGEMLPCIVETLLETNSELDTRR